MRPGFFILLCSDAAPNALLFIEGPFVKHARGTPCRLDSSIITYE